MNKRYVKSILMSMKTNENESFVNNLLGKIDIMDETSFQNTINQIGHFEEDIRNFFEKKLSENKSHSHQKHLPINDIFTYSISGNCIHLHLPGDLHQMLKEKGISSTINLINFKLLDAIDRINKLKNSGFHKFEGKNTIYMISPLLIGKEMKFLESMNFKMQSYRKKDLTNDNFVKEHPESQLAIHIFGRDKNIGTASIDFCTINSKEWQDKKKQKIEELSSTGISLEANYNLTI